MNSLSNKTILFVGVEGYSQGIKKEMELMGAKVFFMDDKPNEGFICKTAGRYKLKFYMPIIERYYARILEKIKNVKFDYILLLRGEYTPIKSLILMNNLFPSAKLVLYMWDSLLNNKGIEKKWPYFDKVITFDRQDYLRLRESEKISFHPLFYFENFLPKKEDTNQQYDITFIGTGHGDRIRIINEVKRQCKELGLKCYTYVFLPHKMVFWYNKLTNKNFKGITPGMFQYKKMPTKTAYHIYGNSKCILDIESITQSGLTMRTIEMVGLHKKLITTNKDIIHYDLYNESNIQVIDRKHFNLSEDFINRPYEPLNNSIYEKYSLRNWILDILK